MSNDTPMSRGSHSTNQITSWGRIEFAHVVKNWVVSSSTLYRFPTSSPTAKAPTKRTKSPRVTYVWNLVSGLTHSGEHARANVNVWARIDPYLHPVRCRHLRGSLQCVVLLAVRDCFLPFAAPASSELEPDPAGACADDRDDKEGPDVVQARDEPRHASRIPPMRRPVRPMIRHSVLLAWSPAFVAAVGRSPTASMLAITALT